MFWSGNYIVVRELNSLLKEENVTLTQVLEADDVLQECKADNKALIQFLTRPDILAELVTLITEEPLKNVELGLQYRHASIACEVLTSQLSTLSDRLSMDTVQMNRLCDFINREPPLNPLLASYFSKTIEMLLERGPKQDWYLYHIVCLRVLDFLKARRDFLPNLLRHLHTSAAADALRCFIRLNDLFNKIVMEWLEEHQFLESLIQIICGTYEPPPLAGAADDARPGTERAQEKGLLDAQGKEDPTKEASPEKVAPERITVECERDGATDRRKERLRAVASANAAALLSDIILNGEGCQTRGRTAAALVAQATSAAGVGSLLQGMFTAPAHSRRHALVNGASVLLAMRRRTGEGEDMERNGVELCVAPHLPLLHTALLQQPTPYVSHRTSSARNRRNATVTKLQLLDAGTPEAPGDGGGGESCSMAPTDPIAPTIPDAPTVPETPAVPETPSTQTTPPAPETIAKSEHSTLPEVSNVVAPVEPVSSSVRAPANEAPVDSRAPAVALPPAPGAVDTSNVDGAAGDSFPCNNTEGASESESCGRATVIVEGAEEGGGAGGPGARPPAPPPPPRAPLGAARLQLCALLAALAGSSVHEVASTMLTLGTPGVLLELLFSHPDNNFLHAHVLALVHNALANRPFRAQYATHLLEECDVVNRLIDVYEENENKRGTGQPRSGHMGHVVQLLRTLAPLLDEDAAAGGARWAAFSPRLHATLQRLDTPLGGYYPSANSYETEGMLEVESAIYNTNYNESASYDTEEVEDEPDRNKFLKIADKRMLENLGTWDDDDGDDDDGLGGRGGADDDEEMWKEITGLRSTPETSLELERAAPWEAAAAEPNTGEGWAQFSSDNFGAPVDPFAASDAFAGDAFAGDAFAGDAFAGDAFASDAFAGDAFASRESFGGKEKRDEEEFTQFWGYQEKENVPESSAESSAEAGMRALRLDAPAALDAAPDAPDAAPLDALSASLADNLRTAMSSMTPEVIANIVNANMTTPILEDSDSAPSVPSASASASGSGGGGGGGGEAES